MKYNLYDFDGTIYDGDSGIDIITYAIRRYPKFIFVAILAIFLYLFKIIDKDAFKSRMFSFVKYVDNIDEFVESFWIKYEHKMKKFWVQKKNHKNDIIISASGYFWLNYIADKYKVADLIATNYDLSTGKIIGNNCHGKEKVKIFFKKYPQATILKMYTDSLNDLPLILESKNGFIVKGDNIIPYNDYRESKKTKLLKRLLYIFNNREIFCYLVSGFLTVVVNLFSKTILLAIFLDEKDSFELQIAVIISWLFAVTIAYILNRIYVFKSVNKKKLSEFISFFFSRILTLLIEMALTWLLVTLLELNVTMMLICIQLIIIILNYIFSKIFVFIKK